MADDDAIVKLQEASSEAEAAMICGFLESRGIPATYDKGSVQAAPMAPGGAMSGPYVGQQEIVVRARDLEAARQALAELESTP
jgi:hypothetical protein